MQYNDTTNKNGIIQTCELLLDLGDAGITGNATLLKQFTNLANRAYDNIVSLILQNEGDYTWDDKNYPITSDYPAGKINLSVSVGSEVSTYNLPSANVNGTSGASSDVTSFLRVIKVQVLSTNGQYVNLRPISESRTDQALTTLFNSPGFPVAYQIVGSGVQLFPTPLGTTVTATNGLKIFFQRDKIDFVSTDTTKVPGFPSIYHYLLPLEMSESWAAIKGMKQITWIQQKRSEFLHNLGWGISNENKDIRQRIQSVSKGNSYE